MSDLRLMVGGRYYTVACADGEEAHIQSLASMIDAKLSAMGTNLSTNEAKNLLFAALFLADDLTRAQAQAARVPETKSDERVASRLERLAGALETVAASLERHT